MRVSHELTGITYEHDREYEKDETGFCLQRNFTKCNYKRNTSLLKFLKIFHSHRGVDY